MIPSTKSRRGAGPSRLLAAQQPHALLLAVDGTNVYLTNTVPDGTVVMVPKAGGQAVTLASSQNNP